MSTPGLQLATLSPMVGRMLELRQRHAGFELRVTDMAEQIIAYRIAGTRITVWNVLHHLENGWCQADIAEVLGLSFEQVRAAVDFIRLHQDEVMAVHRQLEARNERGNSTEIRALAAQARAKRLSWLRDRQAPATR